MLTITHYIYSWLFSKYEADASEFVENREDMSTWLYFKSDDVCSN